MSNEQNYELAAGAAYATGPPRSVRAILWQRFLRHRLAVGSLIVLRMDTWNAVPLNNG